MNTEIINILLIGVGPHAKRIYYPVLEKDGATYNARIACAIDLEEKREDIEKYFSERAVKPDEVILLQDHEKSFGTLKPSLANKIDELIKKHKITGVIISTEPLAHTAYAKWALSNGLSILMDKPISTRENVSTDLAEAQGILEDYKELEKIYFNSEKKNPNIVFSLMAQRRFHPAFSLMHRLIKEVKDKTGCPVTSIQSFHSDGQWRFPTEIVDQDYHPYNQGYGKCSHSGYHFFDITSWLIEAGETEEKRINNVDIFTNFTRPLDFLAQLPLGEYRKIFPDFDDYNKYDQSDYEEIMQKYGEMDAFTSLEFKHDNRIMTLGNVNLAHNGFAQRNWVTAEGRDLYKGNGRVRHESHYIEQGPFQAISYVSYQSKEVNPNNLEGIYDVGGEYHLDIHVFRNDLMFPEWKNYERYSVKDMNLNIMEGKSRGHQEDARREGIVEFIQAIRGTIKKTDMVSEFKNHKRGTALLSGTYTSAVKRFHHENPLINIPF